MPGSGVRACRPPIGSEGFGQVRYGRFGRPIAMGRCRAEAHDRSDIDDRSLAAAHHSRSDLAAQDECAPQIDRHFTIPIGEPQPMRPMHFAEDASCVDQADERTVLLLDRLHLARNGGLVGNVERIGPENSQGRHRARRSRAMSTAMAVKPASPKAASVANPIPLRPPLTSTGPVAFVIVRSHKPARRGARASGFCQTGFAEAARG